MSAAALLAQIRSRGIKLRAEGSELVVLAPDGTLDERDVQTLRESKAELLDLLRPPGDRGFVSLRAGVDGTAAELFDRFLADTSIPLALFHSRPLRRDFILARDSKALSALTEADQGFPVLTFAECDHLSGLSVRDLGAILDAKSALGPELVLREVRPARQRQ